MKSNSLTYKLIKLLVTIVIVYSITSIVPRLISTYLTTYFYLLVLGLCMFLVFVSRGRLTLGEYIVISMPFVLWRILIYIISKPSVVDWGYNTLLELTPIVLGLFITKKTNEKEIKYYAILIIAVIAITVVTTYIGLLENPNAARYLATVATPNEPEYIRYNMLNIGGYEFVYSLVLLYPTLIYANKRGKISSFWTIVLAIAELIFIIETEYTTALILWLLSTVFLFFKKDFRIRNLYFVIIAAVILFLLLPDLVSNAIKILARNIDSESIRERLLAVAGGRAGLENAEDNRFELWMVSITQFLNHPILGNMTYQGGGHSFILDNLAKYGLLGASFITAIYVVVYKNFFKIYRSKLGYGYVVWMFVQTLILSLLNPGMWLNVLCLYMPVIMSLINKEDKPNENNLGNKLTVK